MDNTITFANIVKDVTNEYNIAAFKHRPMQSAHEAASVIREEFEEFWDEVKKKNPSSSVLRTELIQTAAMCVRAIYDLGL